MTDSSLGINMLAFLSETARAPKGLLTPLIAVGFPEQDFDTLAQLPEDYVLKRALNALP